MRWCKVFEWWDKKGVIMEIIIFISGFVIGAFSAYIPIFLNRKSREHLNENMLEQMKLYFENTAYEALQRNSRTFAEQNCEKLDEFFKRFKDKIEDFEKRTEENFKLETENFTRFDMNIKSFLETGNKISQETNSLVNVMKSDNRTQGHWGEIILQRVLEASGLRNNEEYQLQHVTPEGRPDATVFLPGGRCIHIDSKTSFDSWNGYVNAKDETEKEIHLKQFIDSTKSHITGLAKRQYSSDEKSPDFVLMFIPIEGCYSMMFCENCALWDLAWKNNIMPVSPSTLLAALKIINSFHIVDRQNKNAIEISRLCSGMIDKFSALLNDLLKIRTTLDSTLKKLNGTGNILNQIKKIEKLGGIVLKPIPELPPELSEDE